MAYNRNATDGTLSSAQTFADNQSNTVTLAGLQAVVASPDGKVLYAIDPTTDALVAMQNSLVVNKVVLNGYDAASQRGLGADLGLEGASALAVTPDGKFLFVASALENAVAVYATGRSLNDPATTNSFKFEQLLTNINGVTGPRALSVSPDGTRLYVGGASGVAVLNFVGGQLGFANSQSLGDVADLRSIANGLSGDYIVAADSSNNRLYLLTYTKNGQQIAVQQTLTNGSNGIAGLAGASGLAVSADGKFVYVAAAADNAVAAFQLSGGSLSEVAVYREGTLGAHGLIGALRAGAPGHAVWALPGRCRRGQQLAGGVPA